MDPSQDRNLAEIFESALQGNEAAYASFLKQAAEVIRRYLTTRMPVDCVEDVMQETLIAIHHARHTYIKGKPVGPWIYTIARHRMIDFMRKYRRIQKREAPIPEGFEIGTRDKTDRTTDKYELLLHALGKLPEKQRIVIEWMKIKGLSVKETAAKTGFSESAVKVNAFRGYQALRRRFRVSNDADL